MSAVLILNYHRVIEDHLWDKTADKTKFCVKRSAFINQLDFIQRREIPVVSFSDWLNNRIKDTFSVILTFDDGNRSDYEIVLPILKDRGLAASFFPVISFIGEENRTSWEQLKEMEALNFEIGSHGVSHENMSEMAAGAGELELELSKKTLEKKLEKPIIIFAAPFGQYNRKTLQMAKNANFQKVLSTQIKINRGHKAMVLHRWNLKHTTKIEAFEKMLTKGSRLYYKMSFLSLLKNRFSRLFGLKIDSLLSK
ncbi:MAG: polysaccharide deacetylase family protein [Crocinitomix sp.]|nr:polysaccharide deacetylase family protein [Crocinitomix sp.]